MCYYGVIGGELMANEYIIHKVGKELMFLELPDGNACSVRVATQEETLKLLKRFASDTSKQQPLPTA
jgi:hypothetical protein